MRNRSVGLFMYIHETFGGAERRFARAFSSMPIDIDLEILIVQSQSNKAKELINPFIKPTTKIVIFSKYYQLLIYIMKRRFDWICGFTPGLGLISLFFLSFALRSKNLFLCVDSRLASGTFPKGLSGKIVQYKFNLCIYLSNVIDNLYPASSDSLRRKFPNKKILTTPNSFTDLNLFKPQVKENIIVFSGTFIPIKNPDLFVEAINLIQDEVRLNNFRAYICGSGPLESELMSLINRYNCQDILEIPGRIKMEDVLPNSKVFCSLQSITNYPSQSLLEAIATGCFCIATNCGDTSRIVNSDFGELVEFDAIEIAAMIKKAMLFSDERYKQVTRNAREFAENNFDIEIPIAYYTKIINN